MIKFESGNLRVPKWTRPVYMVAAGCSDFRKRYPEKKLDELTMMAFRMLLEENDLKMDPLAVKGLISIAVYGEFADHFQDQLLCEAKVHDYLGLDPASELRCQDRWCNRRHGDVGGGDASGQRYVGLRARAGLGAHGRGQDVDGQLLYFDRGVQGFLKHGSHATTRVTTHRWRVVFRKCMTSTNACVLRSR